MTLSSGEIIRPATADDLPRLCEIHNQAFAGSAAEAKLVELLHRNAKANPSLVMILDGKTVASIVFSPVTIERAPADLPLTGLAPIAVLPEFQRRGIGSRLIHAGLAACGEQNFAAVVVLGNPKYYTRFGFLPAMDFGLSNEYVNDGHFMIQELRDGALSKIGGLVRYGPEFRLAGC